MDFCRCFSAGRNERRRGKRWFPTGRAISAEGGVAVHRGADHVELPRLALFKPLAEDRIDLTIFSLLTALR